MNKLVYVMIIIIALGVIYVAIPEQKTDAKTLDEGIALAKEQNKLVFLYINAEWCGYCRLLEKEFSESEEFQRIIDEHYVQVILDFDKNPDLVRRFNLKGPPAMIILDGNGNVITGIPGYPPNGVKDVIMVLNEALR